MDLVVPDTPPSRQCSRSPQQRFHRKVNRSLFRRPAANPSRARECFESDPNVGDAGDELETVVQETVLPIDNLNASGVGDDSETVVQETVLPLDDSNAGGVGDESETMVQETVLPCDELNAVVPEMSRLLDDSDMVVPELVVLFDESETLSSTSETVILDSRPRTARPKSEKIILELMAIICPTILTLDL